MAIYSPGEDRLGKRQQQALAAVAASAQWGVTHREVGDHGWASGALSNLQRKGLIVRVKEKRDGAELYVLPEFVNGRTEAPYRPRSRVIQQPTPTTVRADVTARAAAWRLKNRLIGAAPGQMRDDLLLVLADYERLSHE